MAPLMCPARDGDMASKLSGAVVRTPKGFKKVLAVQLGWGVDLHGQSSTVAATKAINDALSHTSLPVVLEFVPGGFAGVKVKAKVCTPNPKGVNIDEVKQNSFLKDYPSPDLKVVHGGLRWHSGVIAPGLGDPPPNEEIDAPTSDDEDAPITSNDELFAAVAAIRVGY